MSEIYFTLNVDDHLDRLALWTAHDKRCRYCREPLAFAQLEIDHIIPKNLRSKPDELAECLKELGLSLEYNLDSVDNLLPAHNNCNREKSGKLYGESSLRHFREVAEKAARRFGNLRDRLKQQNVAMADVARIANHVSKGAVTLAEIADVVTNSRPFNPSEDFQRADFVQMSEPFVRIECHLPTEAKPSGSATITFHPLNLRGTQIEISHEVLTRDLFRGLHAPVNSPWRRFLRKPWKTKPIYHLQIGSVSFQLEFKEATQLCRLLDRLHPVYAAAFHRAEIAFAGLDAPLKSPGSYEIASIPLALWQHMEAFVRLHDLAKGNSEWHIFDAPAWVWLKIIKRTATWWEYECFMDVVVKRPNADLRNLSHSSVSLRWDSLSNHPGGREHATGWCWSVKECMSFMFDRLIPKVTSSTWLNPAILATEHKEMQIYRMSGYEPVTKAGSTSPMKAAVTLEKMQSFYIREHDQFIDPSVVMGVFQFLSLMLQHHQLPTYSVGYMGPNLRCAGATTRDELIAQVNTLLGLARRGASVKPRPVTYGTPVDYALRCLLEILRNGEPDSVVNQEWSRWIKLIEPLVKDYNDRSYLVRMRAEDFDDA